MDILGEFKVDEIVDVNIIKVIPGRTVKPIAPHVYIFTPEGVLLVHSTWRLRLGCVVLFSVSIVIRSLNDCVVLTCIT